jgi:2'-5' RNA ligase
LVRPNWFFAFPIQGSFVQGLPALPANFRRFHPEDVHLTLVFLGRCGEPAAMRALAALDGLLPVLQARPIDISLGAATAMGPKRRYTALSALIEQGNTETSALIAGVRDTLTEAALSRRETRPPKPHVTLARPQRRATSAQREAGLAWGHQLDLRSIRGRLDHVALYTWNDERRGRQFRIVARRPLSASVASCSDTRR